MTLMHGSVKNGTQRVRSVPLFEGPKWEELKRLLVIIPKVEQMILDQRIAMIHMDLSA